MGSGLDCGRTWWSVILMWGARKAWGELAVIKLFTIRHFSLILSRYLDSALGVRLGEMPRTGLVGLS